MTDLPKVDVVGVGLNATDTMIPLPHYPALGSKVEFRSANVLPGGQVATAVIACQQWGLRTRYVGKVGEDAAAEMHRAEFAKYGVEAHLFTAAGCASQQAFILIDDAGERTVLWKRDHRLTLQPEELQREWVLNARALHVDGHDTAAASQAARWARAAGVPVIADLDDVYPGVEELLGSIDYLITSRDIPGRLTGEQDWRERCPHCSADTAACLRPQRWDKMAYSRGTARRSFTLQRFAWSQWTPPAQAIFFTPDLFMGFCRAGRLRASSISPAPLRR